MRPHTIALVVGIALVSSASAEEGPLTLKTCGVQTPWHLQDATPMPLAGYRRLSGEELVRTVTNHVLVIRRLSDECISDLSSMEWYRPDGRMEPDPGFWGHVWAQNHPNRRPSTERYKFRPDDLCVGEGRHRRCRAIYVDDKGSYIQVEPLDSGSLISPIHIKIRMDAEPW